MAKAFFEYQEAAGKWGTGSPEAQLIRAKNPSLSDYLSLVQLDTPVPVLEIRVKNRASNDEYAALGADEREAFLASHHEYALDLKRVDAYTKRLPEEVVDPYADYYTQSLKDYEDDWYLMDHKDFYQAMVDQGLWKEKDFTKVPTPEVWEKYGYYSKLPEGTARMEYRLQHKDLDDWLVLAKGYKPAEAPKPPPPPKTINPTKPAVSVPKQPPPKKPRTSRDAVFGRAGQAYDLLAATERSPAF